MICHHLRKLHDLFYAIYRRSINKIKWDKVRPPLQNRHQKFKTLLLTVVNKFTGLWRGKMKANSHWSFYWKKLCEIRMQIRISWYRLLGIFLSNVQVRIVTLKRILSTRIRFHRDWLGSLRGRILQSTLRRIPFKRLRIHRIRKTLFWQRLEIFTGKILTWECSITFRWITCGFKSRNKSSHLGLQKVKSA